MSPKVLQAGALIFWFHSHDALHEQRASMWVKACNRTMLIWDPDKCAINDEVHIADYLGPGTKDMSVDSNRYQGR